VLCVRPSPAGSGCGRVSVPYTCPRCVAVSLSAYPRGRPGRAGAGHAVEGSDPSDRGRGGPGPAGKDQSSYLRNQPGWTPFLPAATQGDFAMPDLISFTGHGLDKISGPGGGGPGGGPGGPGAPGGGGPAVPMGHVLQADLLQAPERQSGRRSGHRAEWWRSRPLALLSGQPSWVGIRPTSPTEARPGVADLTCLQRVPGHPQLAEIRTWLTRTWTRTWLTDPVVAWPARP
jgi:hypothetical protein